MRFPSGIFGLQSTCQRRKLHEDKQHTRCRQNTFPANTGTETASSRPRRLPFGGVLALVALNAVAPVVFCACSAGLLRVHCLNKLPRGAGAASVLDRRSGNDELAIPRVSACKMRYANLKNLHVSRPLKEVDFVGPSDNKVNTAQILSRQL